MQRIVVSAILGLAAGIVGPVASAKAPDPFWLHPYNFFGEETAFTASVNLGDLDGDGDLDAAVARQLMPVLLLFNDGTARHPRRLEETPLSRRWLEREHRLITSSVMLCDGVVQNHLQ